VPESSTDAPDASARGAGTEITGTSTDALDRRLKVGRPEFGEALDGLRERMAATARGLAIRTVGRYRLGRVLGSGAFGTVYEAEDPELDRRVAIKVLTVRSAKEAARVLREALDDRAAEAFERYGDGPDRLRRPAPAYVHRRLAFDLNLSPQILTDSIQMLRRPANWRHAGDGQSKVLRIK